MLTESNVTFSPSWGCIARFFAAVRRDDGAKIIANPSHSPQRGEHEKGPDRSGPSSNQIGINVRLASHAELGMRRQDVRKRACDLCSASPSSRGVSCAGGRSKCLRVRRFTYHFSISPPFFPANYGQRNRIDSIDFSAILRLCCLRTLADGGADGGSFRHRAGAGADDRILWPQWRIGLYQPATRLDGQRGLG